MRVAVDRPTRMVVTTLYARKRLLYLHKQNYNLRLVIKVQKYAKFKMLILLLCVKILRYFGCCQRFKICCRLLLTLQ
jgi:hypothetical protein